MRGIGEIVIGLFVGFLAGIGLLIHCWQADNLNTGMSYHDKRGNLHVATFCNAPVFDKKPVQQPEGEK